LTLAPARKLAGLRDVIATRIEAYAEVRIDTLMLRFHPMILGIATRRTGDSALGLRRFKIGI
jgi:hypothetical protein